MGNELSRRSERLAALEEVSRILSGQSSTLEPTPADEPINPNIGYIRPLVGESKSENIVVTRCYRMILQDLERIKIAPFPIRQEGVKIPNTSIFARLRGNTLILRKIEFNDESNLWTDERFAITRHGRINYLLQVYENINGKVGELVGAKGANSRSPLGEIEYITEKTKALQELISKARRISTKSKR